MTANRPPAQRESLPDAQMQRGRVPTEAAHSRYRPVWLTAEEYAALFAEPLDANDAQVLRRIVQMLRAANERSDEWTVAMKDAPRGLGEGVRSTVIAQWVILVPLFMCLYIIVSRL